MSRYLSDVRKEYGGAGLREEAFGPDPLPIFRTWLEEAIAAEVHEPNAMTLSTATPDGRPSGRLVLLKDFDDSGFCFYTNYASRKGQELAANPWAALTFWWGPLHRQIRIEGTVTKVSAQESDVYYHSRPHGARLGAWVSEQSNVIPSRAVLEERLTALEAEYAERDPERPPFWGGYRLAPTEIEFWQGGRHRLHDRLRYRRHGDGPWRIERLSP